MGVAEMRHWQGLAGIYSSIYMFSAGYGTFLFCFAISRQIFAPEIWEIMFSANLTMRHLHNLSHLIGRS